jgi:cytochrome P450
VGQINLSEGMIDLTKTILFKAMFGGDVTDEDGRLTQALYTVEASINPVSTVMPSQILRRLPTPGNRRLRQAVQTLDEFVYGLIRDRRHNAKEDGDLLSMLLLARDENTGEGMSDEQLRDEAVTILQAGHEPTADALTWTFYLLSQAPAVRQKHEEEVGTVLGDRVPSLEDFPNLVYTTMVIHEALRLYPPAWVIGRSPLEDDRIGGYHVPAKSNRPDQRLRDPPSANVLGRTGSLRSGTVYARAMGVASTFHLLPLRWRAAPLCR